MPAIRDLRGLPVEETVSSREGPPSFTPPPSEPTSTARRFGRRSRRCRPRRATPLDEAEATIRAFAARPLPLDLTEDRADPEGDEARERALAQSRDVEAALDALKTTATEMHIAVTDGVKALIAQVDVVRARVAKNEARLRKLIAVLKDVDE